MSLSNEDIQQLIAILQRGLTADEQDVTVEESPRPAKHQKAKTKKPNKSGHNVSNNKFDGMLEKNMHKEDIEIDKKLSQHPPSLRSREFSKTRVSCRVCGKTEEVNPSLVYEGRYKCNKCAREPG